MQNKCKVMQSAFSKLMYNINIIIHNFILFSKDIHKRVFCTYKFVF